MFYNLYNYLVSNATGRCHSAQLGRTYYYGSVIRRNNTFNNQIKFNERFVFKTLVKEKKKLYNSIIKRNIRRDRLVGKREKRIGLKIKIRR